MLLLLAFGKRPAQRQILRNFVSRGWAAVWISLLYQNTGGLLFSSLPRSYRALGFLVCWLLWGTHSALPAKVRHRNVLGLCDFLSLLLLPKEIGSYDNSLRGQFSDLDAERSRQFTGQDGGRRHYRTSYRRGSDGLDERGHF